MEKFIDRLRSAIMGVVSGFDRLVFRGSLLPLMQDGVRYARRFAPSRLQGRRYLLHEGAGQARGIGRSHRCPR